MTIHAGAFARRPHGHLPPELCDALYGAVSRDPRDNPVVFADRRVYMVKVDIGAYGSPAVHTPPDGSASMLAGQPLLAATGRYGRTRAQDLGLLHDSLTHGDHAIAALTRGVFSLVHYHPGTRNDPRLTLMTDRLGVRPVYYWLGPEYVVWASALRILEAVSEVPRHMDVRAVAEMACLGQPLGSRTPYHGIQVLRAGEVLTVESDGAHQAQYWRWDNVQLSTQSAPQQLARIRDQFFDAVACRSRDDRVAASFLSGGLDSRTVVATLTSLGVRVRTWCFGVTGTQDQVFASLFAKAVNTDHRESPMRLDEELRFSDLMAAALASADGEAPAPERPQLAWSGDGGSVPLGHVYLTSAMVDHLRGGRPDAAIDLYLQQQQAFVSRHLLQPAVGRSLGSLLHQGVLEEMADLHCEDDGRGLYLFLLHNDQARHLATHFEEIDRHRVELQLPFYDGEFLQAVVETQIDWGLYHRLYLDWLRLMPPQITSVPWQAYPGHLPCPLPLPPGVKYQWDPTTDRAVKRSRKRPLLSRARQILTAASFPRELLRRQRLRLATWLYHTGLRDYGYVIQQAGLFYRYWDRCGGRWVVPATAAMSRAPAQSTYLTPAQA